MSDIKASEQNSNAVVSEAVLPDVLFDVWLPENQLRSEVDRSQSIADVIESAPLREVVWSGSISK